MKTLRNTLLTDWHLMRVVRLVIGLFLAFQAYQSQNGLIGIFSAFILFQVVTNTGCCGAAGCGVNTRHMQTAKDDVVEFEEIK